MKLAFLDVGQGSCTVLHKGAHAIIIDCPSSDSVVSYLEANNISMITDVVISHAHRDHCGGLYDLVMRGWPIGRVWINDEQTNQSGEYRKIREMFSAHRAAGRPVPRSTPNSDTRPLEINDIQLEFLAPHHEDRMGSHGSNRMSVLARVAKRRDDNEWDGVALIPGDIDAAGFQLAAHPSVDYSAHWLVCPHHGGMSANTGEKSVEFVADLLARTGAKEIFFSIARHPPYPNMPRLEIVDFATTKATVRCSQVIKACEEDEQVALSKRGFQIAESAGMMSGKGCACTGTIVVDLTEEVNWSKSREHLNHVVSLAEPRCVPSRRESANT